jgi:hypothetical protein
VPLEGLVGRPGRGDDGVCASGDWKRGTALETFGKEVAAGFREREMTALSDILVVDYDLRYEMLTPSVAPPFDSHSNHFSPSPFSYFDYRSHFVDLANQLTIRLSPYVAIHWRTETLDVRHLPSCASLIETLVAIKRPDSPRCPSIKCHQVPTKAHSGTFTKSLTPAHEAAMRGFLAEFDTVAARVGLKFTSLEREQTYGRLGGSTVAGGWRGEGCCRSTRCEGRRGVCGRIAGCQPGE